jgi:hypothetical protein
LPPKIQQITSTKTNELQETKIIADGVREIHVEQFKPRIKQPKTETAKITDNNTTAQSKKETTQIAEITEPRKSPISIPSLLPDNEDEYAKAKLLFALIMNNKKSATPPPFPENMQPISPITPYRMDLSFPQYKPFTTYLPWTEEDLPQQSPIKSTTFTVSTQAIHNDFHNNYMFEFPNDIHIDNMELTNYSLPKRKCNNITEKNNKFYINKELITIPEGYYNRYTLQDQINKVLPNPIQCVLDDDLFITFKSSDSGKFVLIEDSLLLYLGYKKQSYVNSTSYTAEKEIGIGDNVYPITIKNIKEDCPLFIVDADANTVKKTNVEYTPATVDYFDVKIHIENNLNNEFFFKQPHELTFVTH